MGDEGRSDGVQTSLQVGVRQSGVSHDATLGGWFESVVAMDWDRNQTGALLEVVVMRPLARTRLNPFRSSALAIARPETNFTR